jgi:peptidoglycan/LPS O-acetylase OafA/YrhL
MKVEAQLNTTVPIPSSEISSLPKGQLGSGRHDWVDNLRTLMIVLVFNMHACVTYSHVGSWYYNAPPEPSLGMKIPFVFWQAHLQAFFMGLLFFIAGYYAERSAAKASAGRFLRERFRRLGIPTLIYMLVLHPLIVIGLHPGYEASTNPLPDYVKFVTSGRFIGSSGPMWFTFALLIFSTVFLLIRPKTHAASSRLNLTPALVIGLGAGIGLLSFLVRTVQPLGTSFLNFQLCYFSQYLVVFGLGVWVCRAKGLEALAASPVARKAGWSALVLGPIGLALVIAASLPLPKSGHPAYEGGWNFIALGMSVWEQVTGVALGLGVLAFCYGRLNVKTGLSAWLSDRSFGVYLLHAPILVAISLLVQPVRTNAFVMAPVVTILALVGSLAAADLARRVPGLRRVV